MRLGFGDYLELETTSLHFFFELIGSFAIKFYHKEYRDCKVESQRGHMLQLI